MRMKAYSCPNGCKLPHRGRILKEFDDDSYRIVRNDFTYCPKCGNLMPHALKKLQSFFDIYQIHPALKPALQLLYKSEFNSAAREAFVVVETTLREKTGLDLHGYDLAAKALLVERDNKTRQVIKQPLIAINELQSESDKNEQEGIRLMLMGFFQGPRNIYQHNNVGSAVSNVVSIIIESSFFLNLLDGKSITKKAHCISVPVNYWEICERMPNPFDRIRLRRMLKIKKRGNRK